MADTLHVGNQNRQTGTEQLAFFYLGRKWSVVDLLASRTPVGKAAVLVDANRFLDDFDLLNHLRRLVARIELSTAVGTEAKCILPGIVEFIRQEGRSLVFRMALLASRLSLALSL